MLIRQAISSTRMQAASRPSVRRSNGGHSLGTAPVQMGIGDKRHIRRVIGTEPAGAGQHMSRRPRSASGSGLGMALISARV